MCGIAGIIDYSGRETDRAVVERMTQVLRHRGPDDTGIYMDSCVALGHARLSIIDLAGSHQPLCNEDESIWVVFNGEIYNYRELRDDLLARGHVLRTNGDTETLVHLYEEYGDQMCRHLQGMFAFAIWDKRNRTLFAARDRMGIKPFYYAEQDGLFLFASEPKSILQHPVMQASPDVQNIWHYLTFRTVPGSGTLFSGIGKLRPGHALVLTPAGLNVTCYWDIPLLSEREKPRMNGSAPQVLEEAESRLRTSVKRRLISDVPLGAFLSGGVDSSLIVALMRQLSNTRVRTYSIGFRNFSSSELPYARMVADRFETDHHEVVLEPERFSEYLEKLTWMRDSPLSERSDIPLHVLAAEARKDVKVLLSGEGCDELFGGYPKYAYDRFASLMHLVPRPIVHALARSLPGRLRRVEIALRSFCESDVADRWAQWFAPFTASEKASLLASPTVSANPIGEYLAHANGADMLDKMLYVDCKLWLPENLLERGDRMTMATSVEGRVPFLDHEFVEFAFRQPRRMKVRGLTKKWLIKTLAEKYLPSEIIHRRKSGFEVPLADWFRGRLRSMCYDRICERNGLAGQIFSREELKNVLDEHCSGRKDNFLKIWTLLGLSIWYDLFCRGGHARSFCE